MDTLRGEIKELHTKRLQEQQAQELEAGREENANAKACTREDEITSLREELRRAEAHEAGSIARESELHRILTDKNANVRQMEREIRMMNLQMTDLRMSRDIALNCICRLTDTISDLRG